MKKIVQMNDAKNREYKKKIVDIFPWKKIYVQKHVKDTTLRDDLLY